ncbi:MAG: hypothetical protein R2761_12455 [Acidimicrobiales bacterium]
MIRLDAPSVLLQWSCGGLLFGWVTGRHRLVGLGYTWLLRLSFGLLALAGFALGVRFDFYAPRDVAALVVAVVTLALFALSYRNRARAQGEGPDDDSRAGEPVTDPRLDLIAPVVGAVGLVLAGIHAGDPAWLSVARMLVGAAFMGAVSDSMLLGHWYLVQPGLTRAPLEELVRWTGFLWLPEAALFLVPTGMVSVWSGAIDDGYAGMLGWFWGACVVTTIGLVITTLAALKERQYSAVMAATGLLYLAILTGFGIDLVARATLS